MKKKTIKRITSGDIAGFREAAGLSIVDMHYISGSMIKRWKANDNAPISDPSFSLLFRYLIQNPTEIPILRVPNTNELVPAIKSNWDELKHMQFNTRRLGVLMGCTELAGYTWNKGTVPSQTIRMMMLIIMNAIKKDGMLGLERFIKCMLEEAASRDITDEEELWLRGWNSRGEIGQGTIKRITSGDIAGFREAAGLSIVDMHYISGSMIKRWKANDNTPITDPSLSLLFRYLIQNPGEIPILRVPNTNELVPAIKSNWDELKHMQFNTRRLGVLMGCTELAGYTWNKGTVPSQTIRMMMLIIMNAIKKDGMLGLERFIKCMLEEAASRDINDEKQLWLKGWESRSGD